MSIRVRRPATDRLELSQGDYLIVKRDLTAGEYREQLRASTKPMSVTLPTTPGAPMPAAPTLDLDPMAAGIALVQAYLLDWSFCDAEGRPIVIADQPPVVVAAALDMIDHHAYMEVQQAIQQHEKARATALAEEKKTGSGASAPDKTLVSAG